MITARRRIGFHDGKRVASQVLRPQPSADERQRVPVPDEIIENSIPDDPDTLGIRVGENSVTITG